MKKICLFGLILMISIVSVLTTASVAVSNPPGVAIEQLIIPINLKSNCLNYQSNGPAKGWIMVMKERWIMVMKEGQGTKLFFNRITIRQFNQFCQAIDCPIRLRFDEREEILWVCVCLEF